MKYSKGRQKFAQHTSIKKITWLLKYETIYGAEQTKPKGVTKILAQKHAKPKPTI